MCVSVYICVVTLFRKMFRRVRVFILLISVIEFVGVVADSIFFDMAIVDLPDGRAMYVRRAYDPIVLSRRKSEFPIT